ncbi:MAG: hypothetical protein F4Z74_05565 [Acidobacteria bacterium]|nr:hypothetical protein [Acidobacteriota bacterium]
MGHEGIVGVHEGRGIGREQGVQPSPFRGVPGIAGEVVPLLRVRVEVVQLFAPVDVADVVEAFVPDRVLAELVGAEDGTIPGGVRIPEERHEAPAVEAVLVG